MNLASVEIKNYRSLEDVRLDHLGHFNVLIGRNNSGKSALIGALAYLNNTFRHNPPPWNRVITAGEPNRTLQIQLTFQVDDREREEFLGLLSALGGNYQAHLDVIRQSPFLRQMEFSFETALDAPGLLHLSQTRILAQDNQWIIVQHVEGDTRTANPQSRIIHFGNLVNSPNLTSNTVRIDQGNIIQTQIQTQDLSNQLPAAGLLQRGPDQWFQSQLVKYFNSAFFFNPFRHSSERLGVQATQQLAQDGSNLALVLHTINSNDRPIFHQIEDFIQGAVPGIGMLQTPLTANATEVAFRPLGGNYLIPLHDMGGGIEQLLMVATVLLTTSEECPIFLEEPESHLHAGAQRYLIERIYAGDRQIFLTTHSPVFVNLTRPFSMYQITHSNRRTATIKLNDTTALASALNDIGARNSDVLLSDAVLFVEGPGDNGALGAWSDNLGKSLSEKNITVLPLGGGEFAERAVAMRSNILEGISRRASVPHLFALDRDERDQTEIDKLQASLGEHVYFWHKRELENYLLVPRALRAAIRSKNRGNALIIEKLDETTDEQIRTFILTTAESLYTLVLLKRIRNELGGLKGGLLPRDLVAVLTPDVQKSDFADILHEAIKVRVEQRMSEIDFRTLVETQKKKLDDEWIDENAYLSLAPGEDILSALFSSFGTEYNKPKDTIRIAQEMHLEEIDAEVNEVIDRTLNLASHFAEERR